jgi:peptidase M1-like protein
MLRRYPTIAVLLAGAMISIAADFVASADPGRIEGKVTDPKSPAVIETQETIKDSRANSDPVYQQLRQQAKSPEDFSAFASVNNLVLKRDAATFKLKSGEIYFASPIEGRVTAAVFIGGGELALTPPTDAEKRSLELFTKQPALTEEFSSLVIRFTDKTFDEVKSSPAAKLGSGGPQANRARDLYHDHQQLLRGQLHDNRELRTLADLYSPQRPGFFNAFINGSRYNKLIYVVDPLGVPDVSPEEVMLFSYGDSDGGVWTAFHLAQEHEQKTANSAEDHRVVDITRHEIDGTIKGTQLTITDRISFRAQAKGTRVLPFNLYRTLRVSRVDDEQGRSLSFIQEDRDEDADFGVIMAEPLEEGKTYKIAVQYAGGDALRDSGGGNFILVPRSTWYPNNGGTQFGDRAIFDMSFRYPAKNIFIGTGAQVADTREGDIMVAKWSSGTTELAVAGFNYGRFKKKEIADKDSGYNIEFYANEEVPNEIKNIQAAIERAENRPVGQQQNVTGTTLGSVTTTTMAGTALAEAQNATRIFNSYFGKLPYSRVAMTQQPAGNFGQAWPTLIFMPYLAFIDSTQRSQLLGSRSGTDTFWKYVAPHEIAHQWWGHTIGWTSYRDQWMSEGFAEFSASLYVQQTRGQDKFIDFWEEQRRDITQSTPATKDRKPYTIGALTQGYRLSSGKTGAVYQYLIYPKGAYVLHMLRMMMYDQRNGDAKFKEMMKDLVQTHFNRDISTENFKSIVEKHMTIEMDVDSNGRMDWFFNQWVYGTEMPSYRFEYQLGADNSLSGRITQSGVSDNFGMLVPIYLDFGKGWVRLGSATIVGNNSLDLGNIKLPGPAKRAAICVMNDVLALSIQNNK